MRRRLRDGRDMLRSITGMDFGFDLQQWHDYLKESRDGGYIWNRTIDLPAIMKNAMANPEWLETVKVIENAENRRRQKRASSGDR